jgi:hypothetical protein
MIIRYRIFGKKGVGKKRLRDKKSPLMGNRVFFIGKKRHDISVERRVGKKDYGTKKLTQIAAYIWNPNQWQR